MLIYDGTSFCPQFLNNDMTGGNYGVMPIAPKRFWLMVIHSQIFPFLLYMSLKVMLISSTILLKILEVLTTQMK